MKFLFSLPFIFLPFMAIAEATGGYNYGSDLAEIGLIVAGVIAAIVAVVIFVAKRRK